MRVLCGEVPKAIAEDLAVAISTISERTKRALDRLDLAGRRVPLHLAVAAREVARLIIEGLRLQEIAEQRGSSIHTVTNQRRRIYATLGVSGRCGLIRRAAALGCFD
jgi:DNA-binding NarL/FixJ family response regulator